MSVPRGRLIVFEGPEGAGKTTQLRLVCDWLAAQQRPYTGVREPGGTALGNEIRRMLLEPGREINARAEALLFMASRAQLLAEVIKPALERGELVLADRFFLSTYAYQVVGRGLPFDDVRAANRLATSGLVPDLTILLTLNAAVRDARVVARGGADRIESAGHWFHELVERAFNDCAAPAWQAAHPECGPIATVDAAGTEREVLERVISSFARRMPDVFPMPNVAHA
ncbi:MAG: dTMP kinase [Gemmatimonadaceae bacterium]|nr:dTMP kinase [Gemmatimonadaceae bacterium]